jgi:hypothetical protein
VAYHGDDDIYWDGNTWANVKVAGSGGDGRGLRPHMPHDSAGYHGMYYSRYHMTGTGSPM